MATKRNTEEGVPVPTVVISVIVVFVAGLLIGRFTLGKSKKCKASDCPTAGKTIQRYRIYPRRTNPSVGPMNAKVTIVQVSDFGCFPCRRVSATLKKLQKEFPGDVRLVYMNNPSFRNRNARLAAIGGLAAKNQGKFWAYHDKVFANQRKLQEADLIKYAQEAGLNVEKFTKDLKEPRLSQMVAMDQRQARMLGVRSMPAVFINGRYFTGNVKYAALKKVVKEEVKGAKKLLAKLRKEGRTGRGGRVPMLYREFMRGAASSLLAGRGRQRPDRRKRPQEDPKAVYRVPVAGKPYMGTKNAMITIVNVSEFQ